jgi:hypothetical protein
LRSAKLRKFGFKEGNSTGCFSKHGVDTSINNLPVCSLAALKTKFNSELRLHVHLGATTETIEGYPANYCVVFYLGMLGSPKHYASWQGDIEQGFSGVGGNPEAPEVADAENDGNETMFIGVINVSEKRQRVIPCLIRLQTLDCCPLGIGQSVDNIFANIAGSISFEKSLVIPDWECGVSAERRILKNQESPKQVVKGRPQVITNISNKQRNYSRDSFQLLKPEQALSCLSLSYKLDDGFIGLTLKEPLHQVINDLEMLISSAELEKRAIQRVHMLQYPQGEANGEKDAKDSEGARDTRAHKERVS